MDTTVLKEIGLKGNEIDVYLALLELEEALAKEIADKTNLSRTLIYHLLDKLMKKGLISYIIKNNIKYFKPADPNKLLDFLKEKESKTLELIPDLIKLKKTKKEKPKIEVYEGKEGIITILNDLVRAKPKEWLDLTSATGHLILPPGFIDRWEKQRIKAGIKAKIIVDPSKTGMERANKIKKLKNTQVRFFPAGGATPAHIWIYDDRISIALLTLDYPLGILVENKEVAERFRGFFNWLWELAKS